MTSNTSRWHIPHALTLTLPPSPSYSRSHSITLPLTPTQPFDRSYTDLPGPMVSDVWCHVMSHGSHVMSHGSHVMSHGSHVTWPSSGCVCYSWNAAFGTVAADIQEVGGGREEHGKWSCPSPHPPPTLTHTASRHALSVLCVLSATADHARVLCGWDCWAQGAHWTEGD